MVFSDIEEMRPIVEFRKEETLGDNRPRVGLYRPGNSTCSQVDRKCLESTNQAPPGHLPKIRKKRFWGLTSLES